MIPIPNTNAKQVLSLSRLVVPYRDGVTQGKKCRQGTNEIPRFATVHSALFLGGPFRIMNSRQPYTRKVVVENFPIKHETLCMQIRTFPPDFRPSGTMLSSRLRVAFD